MIVPNFISPQWCRNVLWRVLVHCDVTSGCGCRCIRPFLGVVRGTAWDIKPGIKWGNSITGWGQRQNRGRKALLIALTRQSDYTWEAMLLLFKLLWVWSCDLLVGTSDSYYIIIGAAVATRLLCFFCFWHPCSSWFVSWLLVNFGVGNMVTARSLATVQSKKQPTTNKQPRLIRQSKHYVK